MRGGRVPLQVHRWSRQRRSLSSCLSVSVVERRLCLGSRSVVERLCFESPDRGRVVALLVALTLYHRARASQPRLSRDDANGSRWGGVSMAFHQRGGRGWQMLAAPPAVVARKVGPPEPRWRRTDRRTGAMRWPLPLRRWFSRRSKQADAPVADPGIPSVSPAVPMRGSPARHFRLAPRLNYIPPFLAKVVAEGQGRATHL